MEGKDILAAYLDLYKTYREETKITQQLQQSTLQWSSVAVGVLLLFALNLWKESSILAFGFFILVFPSAALMFLNIWLMEVARMMRIGNYLLSLEDKIRDCLGDDNALILFEHWLRERDQIKNRQMVFGYKSGVAIYLGIVVFSYMVANVIFWTYKGDWLIFGRYEVLNKVALTFFTALLNVWFILSARKRVRRYVMS